jgi:hypothetical protein
MLCFALNGYSFQPKRKETNAATAVPNSQRMFAPVTTGILTCKLFLYCKQKILVVAPMQSLLHKIVVGSRLAALAGRWLYFLGTFICVKKIKKNKKIVLDLYSPACYRTSVICTVHIDGATERH